MGGQNEPSPEKYTTEGSSDHAVQYHRLDNTHKLKITSESIIEGFLIQPCTIEVA